MPLNSVKAAGILYGEAGRAPKPADKIVQRSSAPTGVADISPTDGRAELRKNLAELAKSKMGSTDWAFDAVKDDFGAGKDKCNKFVFDILKEAGIPAPTMPGGKWPLMANSWANSQSVGSGWVRVKDPLPGDIAVLPRNTPGRNGHVGIYTGEWLGTDYVIGAGNSEVEAPQDAERRIRGSRASRRPSPTRLSESVSRKIAAPGKSDSQGAT